MSWWPFGSKKPIYEDPDALSELTRAAEEAAKKSREQVAQYRAEQEKERARLEHNKRVEETVKQDKIKEAKMEEEALDRFVNEEFARIMSKKKPFKPF